MILQSTENDVDKLSILLSDSFDDDPIVNWFIRQDDRRDHAFLEFFRIALRQQTLPFGEVYHWDGHAGAALWAPPGKWQLSRLDQLWMAPSIIRISGLRTLKRALDGLGILEDNHPKRPHFYLSFLCSHPKSRGEGIGHALLQAMTDRCDRSKTPIYLENTKEENEAFYKKHGFEVKFDIRLSPQAPYYTGMWRDPQ